VAGVIASELLMPEADGVLPFGHLLEVIHVELTRSISTCLRKD
jgi:hypothetical protein